MIKRRDIVVNRLKINFISEIILKNINLEGVITPAQISRIKSFKYRDIPTTDFFIELKKKYPDFDLNILFDFSEIEINN